MGLKIDQKCIVCNEKIEGQNTPFYFAYSGISAHKKCIDNRNIVFPDYLYDEK